MLSLKYIYIYIDSGLVGPKLQVFSVKDIIASYPFHDLSISHIIASYNNVNDIMNIEISLNARTLLSMLSATSIHAVIK